MANKKITQLASKTAVLSTDLFPIGDATTGTLYKKSIAELQAAIGGAVVSVQGKVGVIVLNTDDISEAVSPTNLYFTNTRARGAISLTTTGSSGASTYSSSTGVLNVPTYTLAGLGGITASFLSGGTGISYNSTTGVISYSGTVYTDASVRGLFSAGTGLSYNSSTGAFSYSGTVYTDSSIRALFIGTSPITYNSTTGAIGITGANLTETTSSVLTITGGTGALLSAASIQVKQASGSQSGFLSSTDWTTFNNKQNTITNPVTGTSTSGYVTFWNSSSSISGDSGLFWDNTNKRLGVGTASPSRRLDVASDGSNWISGTFGGTGSTDKTVLGNLTTATIGGHNSALNSWANFTIAGLNIDFAPYGSVIMRLTDGGNLLVGTTTNNGERLYVSGAIRATGTITANSDITLKKNLLKIENALEKVDQINGYTYEFKADDSKRHAGVIAQEIQEVLPEIVNKGNDGILGVEYGNISALLIEAIKEQQKKINELEVKLIALGQ